MDKFKFRIWDEKSKKFLDQDSYYFFILPNRNSLTISKTNSINNSIIGGKMNKFKLLFHIFWRVDPVIFGSAVVLLILSSGIVFFDPKTALFGLLVSIWMLLYLDEVAKGAIIFQKYMELLNKKEGEQ